MAGNVYSVTVSIAAVTTAQTLIQIKAGATTPLELLRAEVSQTTTETSDTAEFVIRRKTVAATVTSATPLLYLPSGPVADAVGGTAATGTDGSAEGTDSDILYQRGFNVLNGHTWLPTPEGRIIVGSAGIIALISNITVSSATLVAHVVFREFG